MLKIRRTLAATLKPVLAKEPGRYAMGGAHIVPGHGAEPATLEATNGRILLQVPLESVDPEELPVTIPEEHRRRDNAEALPEGGIVTLEALEALKGTGSKASDPYAFLALEPMPGPGSSAGRAAVYCSAKAAGLGDRPGLAGAPRGSYPLVDGEYPRTDFIVAPIREREAVVTLDVGYLLALLRALEGAGADIVEISLGKGKESARQPVGLQGLSWSGRRGDPEARVGLGVIMPVTREA